MFLQNQVGYTIIQRDRMPGEDGFLIVEQDTCKSRHNTGRRMEFYELRRSKKRIWTMLPDTGSVLGLDTMKNCLQGIGNPQMI